MEIDKSKLTDNQGRPLTESLFLELNYSREFAVYTLKEYDYKFEGKVYPSIKRLYLAHEDPLEYDFACRYFLGWQHWLRLNENKKISAEVEKWREELDLKLRSQGVRDIIAMAAEEAQGSFQAAKYMAEKGWEKRRPGRPSKAELEKLNNIKNKIDDELSADIKRMSDYVKKV